MSIPSQARVIALRLLVLLIAVVGLSAFQSSAEPDALDLVSNAQPTSAADTLMYTVRAGRPFLVALPPRRNGEPVTYRLLEGPALSWLVDRSFLWTTTPQERGALPVLIERTAPGAPKDTLVLLIDITD